MLPHLAPAQTARLPPPHPLFEIRVVWQRSRWRWRVVHGATSNILVTRSSRCYCRAQSRAWRRSYYERPGKSRGRSGSGSTPVQHSYPDQRRCCICPPRRPRSAATGSDYGSCGLATRQEAEIVADDVLAMDSQAIGIAHHRTIAFLLTIESLTSRAARLSKRSCGAGPLPHGRGSLSTKRLSTTTSFN